MYIYIYIYYLTCGTRIMYHYPIYGDRPLIGRSNLLYACTNRYFALFSASRWHKRTGRLVGGSNKNMVKYK